LIGQEALIRQWLHDQGGTIQGVEDEILHALGEKLHVRGKAALSQLRSSLCEMAARGYIRVQFDDGAFGTAHIVEVTVLTVSPAAEVASLKEKLALVHAEKTELQASLNRAKDDVEAAGQLADEAVGRQESLEGELRELDRRYRVLAVESEVARKQVLPALSPKEVAKLRKVAGRAVVVARARMRLEEGKVADLRQRLAVARRQIKAMSAGYEFYTMSCGCVIARTDVTKCIFGGRSHPIFPAMVPNLSYEEAKKFVTLVMAQATAILNGGGPGLVLSSDIRGRMMP